jgi:hypothetical protein
MTFTPYSNTGPFTNNTTPPGVSATFLNNIENFLDQIDSSVVADSNITANGAGALGAASLTVHGNAIFTLGSIARISKFSGTGTGAAQTVSHGLGATPDLVFINYAGNFGSPPNHPAYWYNTTSTQVTIVADNTYFWWAIAIKF